MMIYMQDIISEHTAISNQLEKYWLMGEAIITALFIRRRIQKHVTMHELYKKIIRIVRHLGKYENLRSSLEGMMFEQIQLDIFTISDYERQEETLLTNIYFGWKGDSTIMDEISIIDVEHIAEEDFTFLLCYFMRFATFLASLSETFQASNLSSNVTSKQQKHTEYHINKAHNYINSIVSDMMRTIQLFLDGQ